MQPESSVPQSAATPSPAPPPESATSAAPAAAVISPNSAPGAVVAAQVMSSVMPAPAPVVVAQTQPKLEGRGRGQIDYTALAKLPHSSIEPTVLVIAGLFLMFFPFVGIPLLLVGGYLYFKHQSMVKSAFAEFLATNGFQVDPIGDGDYIATSLLGVGHGQQVVSGFSGPYRGRVLHGAHYRYYTGNGRNQQQHNFLNLCVESSEVLPLILLDSKANKTLGIFRDLPERIPGGKSFQLEGDFADRFSITVMPGTEQDVLQLMTPDFMQSLMSVPPKVDIELEENSCFMIVHNSDFNAQSLHSMFSAADVVLDQLDKIAGTWQASSSAETLGTMAAQALAPRASLMLRPRHIAVGTLIGAAVYGVPFLIGLINGH